MGLYEHIVEQPVRSLSLRELIPMPPDARVGSAIEALREKRLGCVVIVDEEGRPMGAFTERSVARALESGNLDLEDTLISHSDERWVTVGEDEPIERVLDGMIASDTRFVCVTDSDGRAVALTGQKGVVECVAEYFPDQVRSMVRRIGAETVTKSREGV